MNKLFKKLLLTVLIAGSFFTQNIFGMQEENSNIRQTINKDNLVLVVNDFSLLEKATETYVEAFAPVKKSPEHVLIEEWNNKCRCIINNKHLIPVLWIAIKNVLTNKIIAFSLSYNFKNKISGDFLAIHPLYQGLGLARRLIFYPFEKLDSIKNIEFSTWTYNINAQQVYAKLGFDIKSTTNTGIFYNFSKEKWLSLQKK